MITWAARILLYAAGVLTGWFTAQDAPNFGVIQMAVALGLLVLLIAIIAFWPERWRPRARRGPQEPGAS